MADVVVLKIWWFEGLELFIAKKTNNAGLNMEHKHGN